jgi:hypothetical protein
MELEAADHAVREQAARFAHTHLSLVRIDARERHHDVRVLARSIRHFLVRNASRPDLELGIDREHHEADLAFAIVGDGLRDGGSLARLEVLGGGILEFFPLFVRLVSA